MRRPPSVFRPREYADLLADAAGDDPPDRSRTYRGRGPLSRLRRPWKETPPKANREERPR